MPRLVICNGIQYDADRLPVGVDASTCMSADEWFAANRTPRRQQAEAPVAHTPKRKARR